MAIDVFISEEKIQERIKELAEVISKDYKGEEVIVVGVLNGCFMFCADLLRELDQMRAERPYITRVKRSQFNDPGANNQANLHDN